MEKFSQFRDRGTPSRKRPRTTATDPDSRNADCAVPPHQDPAGDLESAVLDNTVPDTAADCVRSHNIISGHNSVDTAAGAEEGVSVVYIAGVWTVVYRPPG